MKAFDKSACINILLAIGGAIQGKWWHTPGAARKAELKVSLE